MSEYNISFFEKDLKDLGISLSDYQINQFLQYYEILMEKNKVMNLTAITEFDEVVKKHFIDSLSLVKAYDCNGERFVLDLGTGAGFPGIPLKIAFPDLRLVLMDSLNKRIKFLQEVIDLLCLEDIQAVHGRAEDFAKEKLYREQFDLCVSRAVANLRVLSEYCVPFVKTGGYFIPYKSERVGEELAEAEKAISILGGCIEKQIEFYLPDSSIYRNLILIRKEKNTPGKFPRKAGLPTKEPL